MKAIKVLAKYKRALVIAAGVVSATPSFAAGPDFSTLTAAVDFSTVQTAIMGVFATIAGIYVIIRGGGLVLSKIRR